MRRDADKVSAEVCNVAIDFAGALHGIDVQHTERGVHDLRDLSDRLHNAGFVVGKHH